MFRICAVVLLGLWLAGCSPDYNWRQASVADGAVTAFFPERTVTQSRPIQFDDHELDFSLTSSVVGDASFTIAYAALPQALRDNPQRSQAFAKGVVQSLYRNLGAAPPDNLPQAGAPFTITGATPQGTVRIVAAVWLTNNALIEALVTADADSFPDNAANEFMRGVKLP